MKAASANVVRQSKFKQLQIQAQQTSTVAAMEASAATSGTTGQSVDTTINQANYNAANTKKSVASQLQEALSKIQQTGLELEMGRTQAKGHLDFDVGGSVNNELGTAALSGLSTYLSNLN